MESIEFKNTSLWIQNSPSILNCFRSFQAIDDHNSLLYYSLALEHSYETESVTIYEYLRENENMKIFQATSTFSPNSSPKSSFNWSITVFISKWRWSKILTLNQLERGGINHTSSWNSISNWISNWFSKNQVFNYFVI